MGGIVLGGKNERFHRIHGDIVASYTYVNDERAMVLWPRFRKGVTPLIVCDSAAWKYDDERYLAVQAKTVADLWGDAPDSKRWFQIAKIIHDGLQDLVRLPPAPLVPIAPRGPVIGEAALRANGKTIAGGEITMPTAEEMQHYERRTH